MAKDGKAALGGGARKRKRTPNIHIRPTANGGFIAQHSADPNAPPGATDDGAGGPQEYGLSDKAALMAHMDQHIPDDSSTQPEAGEQ